MSESHHVERSTDGDGRVEGVRSSPVREWAVRVAFFALMAGVYLLCPVSYSPTLLMATTGEVLLTEGHWHLDGHKNLPYENETLLPSRFHPEGRLHFYFPAGNVISSLPFVVVARSFGWSSIDAERNYLRHREAAVMGVLAALVTAGTCLLLYELARTWLSIPASLAVALICGLGTQLLSTLSTAMWPQTWGVFFETLGLLCLVRGRWKTAAMVFAWAFFCRPTIVIPGVCAAVYLFRIDRRASAKFVAIGAAGFALFVVFSLTAYGRVLPVYYCQLLPDSISGMDDPGEPPPRFEWEKVGRDLISPSRGLFICVPISLAAIGLGATGWRRRRHRPLLVLVGCVFILHMLMLGFHTSGPGYCFGARYTADLVPLLALAAALGLEAKGERLGRVEWCALSLLVVLSVSINLIGSCREKTARWNWRPNLDRRVWSWRDAQWLASDLNDSLFDDNGIRAFGGGRDSWSIRAALAARGVRAEGASCAFGTPIDKLSGPPSVENWLLNRVVGPAGGRRRCVSHPGCA